MAPCLFCYKVWSLELLSNETRLISASSDREMRVYEFAPPEVQGATTGEQEPAWEKVGFTTMVER